MLATAGGQGAIVITSSTAGVHEPADIDVLASEPVPGGKLTVSVRMCACIALGPAQCACKPCVSQASVSATC